MDAWPRRDLPSDLGHKTARYSSTANKAEDMLARCSKPSNCAPALVIRLDHSCGQGDTRHQTWLLLPKIHFPDISERDRLLTSCTDLHMDQGFRVHVQTDYARFHPTIWTCFDLNHSSRVQCSGEFEHVLVPKILDAVIFVPKNINSSIWKYPHHRNNIEVPFRSCQNKVALCDAGDCRRRLTPVDQRLLGTTVLKGKDMLSLERRKTDGR